MTNLRNERLGETKLNVRGEKMRIIEYKNTHNIIVEFECGAKVHTHYYEFKKGRVFCHRKKSERCEVIEEEEIGNGIAVDIAMAFGGFVLVSLIAMGIYALLGGEL